MCVGMHCCRSGGLHGATCIQCKSMQVGCMLISKALFLLACSANITMSVCSKQTLKKSNRVSADSVMTVLEKSPPVLL